MNTIVWSLQGNRLKVAECEFHCIVVTRKWSLQVIARKSCQSCGIQIPFYCSNKEKVLKLKNINTKLCLLQVNRLKVADYEYHIRVITRKSSQSLGISMPLYGSYMESVS